MKKNIKNKLYRQFLDKGIIQILNITEIKKVLENIKGKYQLEAKALVIIMYYTGARPNECLRLTPKDITINEEFVMVSMPSSKKGLKRQIHIKVNALEIKHFIEHYEKNKHLPELNLFWHYRNKYLRKRIGRTGKLFERFEITDNLRYHFLKWFKILDNTVPPYYLRHNRFSKLAEKGADLNDLRFMKGSKTYESIFPYLHMSTEKAKKLADKLD